MQNVWGRINYERNLAREEGAKLAVANSGYITVAIDVSEAVINGSARREIIPRYLVRT